MRIDFYKNNQLIELGNDSICFNEAKKKIIKENETMIITLDFSNNTCVVMLKEENIKLDIPVLKMAYNQSYNGFLFEYILVSEPEVENKLIIYKI